jgi:hypothetical protein
VSSGTGLREEAWAVEILGWAMHYGPTPVEEGTRLWQHPLEQVKGNREAEACAVLEIAYCRAMLGDFSEVQRGFGLSDSARDRGLRSISGGMRLASQASSCSWTIPPPPNDTSEPRTSSDTRRATRCSVPRRLPTSDVLRPSRRSRSRVASGPDRGSARPSAVLRLERSCERSGCGVGRLATPDYSCHHKIF